MEKSKGGPPPKLPVLVTAMIRGPLGEIPATVIDLSPLGAEMSAGQHLALNERVGLTIRSKEIRGPGVSVPGDVRVCREESPGAFYLRVDFSHTGTSEKSVQTFLWELEDRRRRNRR